jgi:hypothetical protein
MDLLPLTKVNAVCAKGDLIAAAEKAGSSGTSSGSGGHHVVVPKPVAPYGAQLKRHSLSAPSTPPITASGSTFTNSGEQAVSTLATGAVSSVKRSVSTGTPGAAAQQQAGSVAACTSASSSSTSLPSTGSLGPLTSTPTGLGLVASGGSSAVSPLMKHVSRSAIIKSASASGLSLVIPSGEEKSFDYSHDFEFTDDFFLFIFSINVGEKIFVVQFTDYRYESRTGSLSCFASTNS